MKPPQMGSSPSSSLELHLARQEEEKSPKFENLDVSSCNPSLYLITPPSNKHLQYLATIACSEIRMCEVAEDEVETLD
jgi:hypothetical protein